MKKIITVLATIGVFVIAGAIGNDDVMVMSHAVQPLGETLMTCFFGFCLIVPAIVRGILWQEIH